MEDYECGWCGGKNRNTAMVSGHKMPIICKCGSGQRYIDWRDLRELINERDYYKKKFYKKALTKKK